jgi:hypothetical protein
MATQLILRMRIRKTMVLLSDTGQTHPHLSPLDLENVVGGAFPQTRTIHQKRI